MSSSRTGIAGYVGDVIDGAKDCVDSMKDCVDAALDHVPDIERNARNTVRAALKMKKKEDEDGPALGIEKPVGVRPEKDARK